MARNEIQIAATPERVWEVLGDPDSYGRWVVGTRRIRAADEAYPAVGTRLHHTIGLGPLTIRDSTRVVASEPPRLLRLEAGLGPLGSAEVELELRPESGGTRLVMRERAGRGPTRLLYPPGELLLRGRNLWSLDRLKKLVERG